MKYQTLDLHFQNLEHAIASFLIETDAGPILVESGPYSTFPSLQAGVNQCGYQISDISNVLLSHIHFDHAGGAWALAKEGANIHLHPFGAGHMHDPTKLVASATMIYGDQMDLLWGKMENIEESKLKIPDHEQVVTIGNQQFLALYTPGHAKHHIAWKWGDIIFTGDVAGVKIDGGPVVPPCPPPDINLEDWNDSIDLLIRENPAKLVLTHYGEVTNVVSHLNELKEILNDWAYWVKIKWEEGLSADEITPQFVAYTTAQLRNHGVADNVIQRYNLANPSWMSVAGLMRYWKKKSTNA